MYFKASAAKAALAIGLSTLVGVFGAMPATLPLSERDDVPWEELEGLVDANSQDWVDECLPEFLTDLPARTMTYEMHPQESVADAVFFKGWQPDDPSAIAVASQFGMTAEEFLSTGNVQDVNELLDPSNSYYNLPMRVMFPTSAGDIVSVVEFAQANMVELSVKNTGHHYAGASGKEDTLLVNMRDFKKYSSDGIVDCSSAAVDDSDNACKYAIGRNVPGYIRVGGGEIFSEVYSSVRAYNEAQEGGFKFHAVGGYKNLHFDTEHLLCDLYHSDLLSANHGHNHSS
eukprot:scaffold41091_cov21-Cyclotella_meneghiniana.AAC.1